MSIFQKLVSEIKPKRASGGGNARTLALTVKNIVTDKGEDNHFVVTDSDGKEWKLISRNDQTPVDKAKVKRGGMVIAEGTFEVDKAETPTLNSRYITMAYQRAGEGEVMTAVATMVGRRIPGAAGENYKIQPQVNVLLDQPQGCANIDALMDKIAQGFVSTSTQMEGTGWPAAHAQVCIQDKASGETYYQSYSFSPATEGAAGYKKIAKNVEVQKAALMKAAGDGESRLATLANTLKTVTQSEYKDQVEVSLNYMPGLTMGPGRDTALSMLQDPVFTGTAAKSEPESADGDAKTGDNLSATRYFPRENYQFEGSNGNTIERQRFMYAPVLLVINYAKGDDGIPNPNKSFVAKIRTVQPSNSCPTASQESWAGMDKVFAALVPDATQTQGLQQESQPTNDGSEHLAAEGIDSDMAAEMASLDFTHDDLAHLEDIERGMSSEFAPNA